jgi:tetratricopeptide (TPR) repeat protein
MRTLLALALFASPVFSADPKPAPKGPLSEARERLLKGNYDEARAGYEKFAADAKHGPAAAVGISRAWRAQGEYDKAAAALNAALKTFPDHLDLLAERGDLFFDLGKWDEASADADAVLKKKDGHFLARWVKARLLRDRGDTVGADQAARWFVRTYNARSQADQDISDPDELLLVVQAGAENARWHSLTQQFRFILNEVIGDTLKFEPDQWRAEYLAGSMLLEKYNRPDALEAFDKALKINPNAAEPYVGRAVAALHKFEVKDADTYADQALKLNPKLPAALRVKADVRMISGEVAEAEKLLLAARAVNPRDATTLGKLAACYVVQRKGPEFAAVVKDAEGYDARPGQFYADLAESLEDRRLYSKAEEYFKKAADLRPMFSAPRTGLGMLYLRLGKEEDGRKILDQAFKADPFNVRVANSIKVMRHLDKFSVIQTPHYEVKYDPKTDKVLAEFVAEYLEDTHAELRRQFGYEPPGRIPFEVFDTHEMFSGRTVGLPDLHTIGACTGRVVAMASPRAKGVAKPFNWGRVIRHELTHVFNLAQTDYQCPHWLTEGLAVRNEKMERPQQWTQILREKFDADELFTLDTVMLGFVRPRGPDEWTLAYCQSQLYVEFMTKTYGESTVAKLLDAYRDGKDTGAAVKAACGVEKAEFEKGYKGHIEQLLKPFRSTAKKAKAPEEKPLTFAQLEEENKKNPDDPDVAARLAEQYMRRGKPAQARKLADGVLAKQKGHPVAAIVKARLLSLAGDDEAAKGVLEDAIAATPDNARLLLAVGRFYIETKEYGKAAEALEKGRKAAPLDGDWLEQLTRLYTQTKETDKLLSVLKELVAHDPDELDGRVKLAKAALEAGKLTDAEFYARDAIQIDVTNDDARQVLLDVLKAAGKEAEAKKLEKRFAVE